ncbi:MAG: DUF1963 domain-containing protein [Pseudomonadota bacterium]
MPLFHRETLIKVLIIVALVAIGFMLATRKKPDAPTAEPLPEPAVSDAQVAQWKSVIDANALPAIKIRLSGKKASSPIASKVGGRPYWTADLEYPVGSDGQPLHLLAQINFAEISAGLDTLPETGLLQFFIASEDLYGSDFSKPDPTSEKKRNYAVVFHAQPDTTQHVDGTGPDPHNDDDLLPMRGESTMTFERSDSRPSPHDCRFETLLPGVRMMEASEPLYDYAADGYGHQLGGYATFTQTDPREGDGDDWQLLFQIDSETVGELDMMWGDVGIANFFILPDDLARGDFSRVWYNWDCS